MNSEMILGYGTLSDEELMAIDGGTFWGKVLAVCEIALGVGIIILAIIL
jgi:hypothetical protein